MNDSFVPTMFKFASLYAIAFIALIFTTGLLSLIFDLDVVSLSTLGLPFLFLLPFAMGAAASLHRCQRLPAIIGNVLGALTFWGGTVFVLSPRREGGVRLALRLLLAVAIATLVSSAVGATAGALLSRLRGSQSDVSERREGDRANGPGGGDAC